MCLVLSVWYFDPHAVGCCRVACSTFHPAPCVTPTTETVLSNIISFSLPFCAPPSHPLLVPQPDVLLDITPEALVSLAGDPAGRAAYLLLRLAFVVCLAAGLPLLVGPFRRGSSAGYAALHLPQL